MQKKASPQDLGEPGDADRGTELGEPKDAKDPKATAAHEVNDRRGRTRRFALASGDRPLDGFTIKRGVGTGGFGEVYYATTDAGKEVALKRIERNLDIEVRGVRQCLNLKHQNLVAVFDIKYDEDDQAWVVMEFVSGASLAEVIERNPNGMPLDEVNRWFDGITAGTAHLHESGIVHRDLKPGNIFSDQTTVKIGDYGLSKFISCSRRSGHTQSVGTFHYMAPEVGQGRYGKEIDIYAIGIMLYEMITGTVPYDGESSHEIIMKHLTATPVLTGIPEPYRSVIGTALAKDPAVRKMSVAQMREIIANHEPGAGEVGHAAGTRKTGAAELAAFAPLFQGTPIEASMKQAGSAFSAFSFANEPVAQGITRAYHDMARGWQQTSIGTATKFALLLLAIPAVLYNTRWLLPMLLVTALTYGLYFLIRGLIIYAVPFDEVEDVTPAASPELPSPNEEGREGASPLIFAERSPVPTGIAAANQGRPILAELAPMNRRQRRYAHLRQRALRKIEEEQDVRTMRAALRRKNGWQHSGDLLGSWVLATLVCGVAGMIFLISKEMISQGEAMLVLPTCVWAIATSAIAASGMLFMAKSWEASAGDGILRRFLQLLVGMATGCAAWGLQQFMGIQPDYILPQEGLFEGIARVNRPNALVEASGYPSLIGFIAFFGILFLMIRWWRQTDPIRGTRLSLWRTILSGLAGLAAYILLPIPGGILIAVTTSVAVQIGATYMDHDERRLVCDKTIG